MLTVSACNCKQSAFVTSRASKSQRRRRVVFVLRPFLGFVKLLKEYGKMWWVVVLRVRITRRAEGLSRCATSQKRECRAYENGERVGDAGRGKRD